MNQNLKYRYLYQYLKSCLKNAHSRPVKYRDTGRFISRLPVVDDKTFNNLVCFVWIFLKKA